MGFIEGAAREQPMLLPARVEDYVPSAALVRVIEAFVGGLDLHELGFQRPVAAGTGRPGYDPRLLLQLYIYGYLNGVRSSRRLERECHINVEVMWLMRKLAPDFKTIADFRRDNTAGIVGCCAAFVQFCRATGLVAGAVVAIDGSKLRAVASGKRVMSAAELAEAAAKLDAAIGAHLAEMDAQDATEADEPSPAETAKALKTLLRRRDELAALAARMAAEARELGVAGEPEARPMAHCGGGKPPSYNLQIAVEAHSHIVVHHDLTSEPTDNRLLAPVARAAKAVLAAEQLTVLADAGYSNASQAADCEAGGISPAVPSPRTRNSAGDFYTADQFVHDSETDSLTCPAGHKLRRCGSHKRDRMRRYRASDCTGCPLKPHCTSAAHRTVYRPIDEAALKRMNQRADDAAMRSRRCTAEHPFACIKRRLGRRLLLRGRLKASAEAALAVLCYNLTRVTNLLGVHSTITALGAGTA